MVWADLKPGYIAGLLIQAKLTVIVVDDEMMPYCSLLGIPYLVRADDNLVKHVQE